MNLLCIKIWCLRFVILKIYILPPDGSGAYTVFLFNGSVFSMDLEMPLFHSPCPRFPWRSPNFGMSQSRPYAYSWGLSCEADQLFIAINIDYVLRNPDQTMGLTM